jgi:hypothetical protein
MSETFSIIVSEAIGFMNEKIELSNVNGPPRVFFLYDTSFEKCSFSSTQTRGLYDIRYSTKLGCQY